MGSMAQGSTRKTHVQAEYNKRANEKLKNNNIKETNTNECAILIFCTPFGLLCTRQTPIPTWEKRNRKRHIWWRTTENKQSTNIETTWHHLS